VRMEQRVLGEGLEQALGLLSFAQKSSIVQTLLSDVEP
jgi:hypothetical protein